MDNVNKTNSTNDLNSSPNSSKKPNKCKVAFDKFFHISERGSNFKTESVSGVINFMVMCYVTVVIPTLLMGVDSSLKSAFMIATILSIVVCTLAMAFCAKLPLVMAPGIGICSYVVSLVGNGTYTFSQALALLLVSGSVYFILTLTGVRQKIIDGLPKIVLNSIPVGLGLFIASLALRSSSSGILDFLSGENISVNLYISVAVALFGFIMICVLSIKKFKGAIFIGIVCATALDIILKLCTGTNPFAVLSGSWLPDMAGFFKNCFQFDFKGAFITSGPSVFSTLMSAIMIVLSLLLVDIFDTLGTLYGACKIGNLYDKDGNMLGAKRAMIVDACSSVVGTCFSVTPSTVYVESTAGIASGGKTGFSSLITSLLFVVTLFLMPIINLIPAYATSPALLYVGLLMFKDMVNIDLTDFISLVTCFTIVILMPLTGNISFGIAGGMIIYCVLKLLSGKGKEVPVFTYICSVLFLVYFATQGIL